ncbi:MAG: hypothetical protein OXG11_00280 [Chloroflexi bacterium]|nr:hypothetical protein [Chloroflexota bacterium]
MELSNLSGSITVRPWERHEVRVTATIDADGARDLIDVSIEGSGNVVTAKARPARIDGNWVRRLVASNNIPSVHFEISCPGTSDVFAKSAAGDIDIANLEGRVDVDQAAGRTRIADHVGRLDIKGVSGAFSGTKLDGPVSYKSVTGNLEILDSRVPGLSIQTVSSKVIVDPLTVADGPVSIHTVSDQTRLVLDPASRCTVTLRTVTGTINTDLPFEVLENSRTKWEAQLNGGGRVIGLKSVSGDFDLISASPVSETSDTSAPRTRQPNTATVLKSLEGGDIDVDEALKLLESGSHPSNPNPK